MAVISNASSSLRLSLELLATVAMHCALSKEHTLRFIRIVRIDCAALLSQPGNA